MHVIFEELHQSVVLRQSEPHLGLLDLVPVAVLLIDLSWTLSIGQLSAARKIANRHAPGVVEDRVSSFNSVGSIRIQQFARRGSTIFY